MLMIISLFRRDVYIYNNITKKQYIHEFSFLQKRLYSMFVSTKYVSTTVIMFVSTEAVIFNVRFYKVRFYNGYNVRFYNGYNVRFYKVRFYSGYNVRFYKVRFYNGYNVRFYSGYVRSTAVVFNVHFDSA